MGLPITKELEPILTRSNVTTHLRQIRKEITRLAELELCTLDDQLALEDLRRAQQELKDRFIFLIVDNTECTSSATPKPKD